MYTRICVGYSGSTIAEQRKKNNILRTQVLVRQKSNFGWSPSPLFSSVVRYQALRTESARGNALDISNCVVGSNPIEAMLMPRLIQCWDVQTHNRATQLCEVVTRLHKLL